MVNGLPVDVEKTRAVSVIADVFSAGPPTLTVKRTATVYAFLAMTFRANRLVRRSIGCIDVRQSRTVVVSQLIAAGVID